MSDHALEVQGLGKRYPDFALDDVSFALPRGYVMGLIGPNGAGKTTILKLVMNLVGRTAGNIEVFGRDSRAHEIEVKSRIGFVYDEPCFPDDATARDLGRAIGPFYPRWSDERFRSLLGQFGVLEDRKFKKLSQGMQMKLALALALAHDADLLLMDEPTAGLDLGFRRELLGHLSVILQDEGKSVLFSTHVTSDLERIADFITFIREGRLVFSLPKDDLRDRWGIVKGNGSLLGQLEGLPVQGVRESPYGVEVLVADVAAARELCGKHTIIDRATLDDVMVFMTRDECGETGGSHVDAR